jgi:hypothetical protein
MLAIEAYSGLHSQRASGQPMRLGWTLARCDYKLRIMISVEANAEAIHLRIPRGEVSDARLAELLRGLRLEAAVAGNAMTDADAEAMAETMKADCCARNQHRFIPPGRAPEA